MKTTPWIKLCKGAALALAVSYGLTYCHTTKSKLTLEQKGDSLTVIHITYPANYILLGSSSNLVVISFLFQLSSSFLILLKVVDMFAF